MVDCNKMYNTITTLQTCQRFFLLANELISFSVAVVEALQEFWQMKEGLPSFNHDSTAVT